MSEVEVITLFVSNLYRVERKDFLPQVRSLVAEYIAPCSLAHEMYPVKKTNDLSQDERIQPFCKFTAETALGIMREQGAPVQGRAVYFDQMFAQEHHKLSGMEQHVHPGDPMVGFYFINVPQGSSVATFYDPRPGKVMASFGEHDPSKVTYVSDAVHLAVEEGQFVFTNGWLPHSFTRHGTDLPLLFLHFNIRLTEPQGVEPPEVI